MNYWLQTFINGLSMGAIYALIAIGVALVFSVMRLVNFAHAGFLMLGGYVLVATSQLGIGWQSLLVLGISALAAYLMERLVFRPLRGAEMMTLLVASYSLGIVLQSIASVTAGTRPLPVQVPDILSERGVIGGFSFSVLSLVTLLVAGVCLLGLITVLKYTRVGLEMRATASDLDMTKLLGVRPNRATISAFVLSGVLAGVAALLLVASTSNVYPSMGFNYVIVAFIACVIGGMGSLPGAALGGLIVGLAMSFLQALLPGDLVGYRDALLYGGVILVLLLRPAGLLGRTLREV